MQENKVFKAKTPARYFTSGCFYIKKTEPMLGFKFAQRGVPLSSCVNFLTEISPGPALAVFAFAFGAVTGYQMIRLLGLHTIWISCGLLLVSFVMMIPKEAEHEAD